MSFLEFAPKTGSRRFAASFAAALLATTCAASAASLSYTTGTITGLPITLLTPDAMSGMAGQIQMNGVDGLGLTGLTLDVWCVDLTASFLPGGGTYGIHSSAYLISAPGLPSLSPTQIGEMGALALNGDSLVASPGSYSSAQVATTIQIAIWHIEYGTAFTYDLLGSPIDGAPPSGLVAQYISNVGLGNPWGEDFVFGVFSEPGVQTVIYAPPPGVTTFTGTPEPSTSAMMLIGFAGLGFAGYGRVKAKAAFAQA